MTTPVREKLVLKAKGNEYLPMTASKIMDSLRTHHSRDVFVEECKNGQSWGEHLLRMDAWAMPRSYSPFRTIGYEVKVDRADFENDQKWVEYVDYCHQFFFVCPAGLIRSTDLPKGIGLMWVSQSGRLHTKTHATKHTPDPTKLINLLTYVVMARSVIADNMYDRDKAIPKDHLTLVREATEQAIAKQELSYFVKGHAREVYEKTMQLEGSLKRREATMKDFTDRLEHLGITWDSTKEDWRGASDVNEKIRLLKQDVGDYEINELARLGGMMIETAKKLREYKV